MDTAIEVAKIGGSLLTRGDFVPAIRHWLDARIQMQPGGHRVLLVGGGPLVDALRQLDGSTPLDDSDAHWRAIELMQIAGRIVGSWLPEWTAVESYDKLRRRTSKPGISLFFSEAFLLSTEPELPGRTLPTGWHVTSDSIAARLAICLGARRLLLLKSRGATPGERSHWDQAVAGGLVDAFFPHLAGLLPEVCFETLPDGGGDLSSIR